MADILELGIPQDDISVQVGLMDDASISKLKEKAQKRKGRGFGSESESRGVIGDFETLETFSVKDELDCEAQKSLDSWVLMVTGVHEEAHEDDILDRFAEYGTVKDLHLNLDRRTGFLKGYALVAFELFQEAKAAKTALNGADLLGNKLSVDWAFMKKPIKLIGGRSRRL